MWTALKGTWPAPASHGTAYIAIKSDWNNNHVHQYLRGRVVQKTDLLMVDGIPGSSQVSKCIVIWKAV